MKRDPNCDRCPLHETAEFVCLLGKGPEPCDAMIVGEAPGEREDDSGTPFVGRAGQLLDEMMEDAGLSRSQVFVTNAVSCRPPNNRTPRKREIAACSYWLNKQIKAVKPKFVLALGNVALESLLGIKGIRKHRGRPVEHNGQIILPTYHPAYILRGDGRERGVLEQDLRTFKSIIDFGGIPHERALNSTVVNSAEAVDDMLAALEGVVSCDIETTCLYPWAPEAKIVTLGFGTRSGEFSIPINHKEREFCPEDIDDIIERVSQKLSDCIVVFQAGKFDLLWIKQHLGVLWQNDFDTMLAHHLLDENSPHDIEYIAKIFFSAHPWDIPLSEKQGNVEFSKLAKYHAHDLFYTRGAYFKLRARLKEEPKVERLFYKLVMPIANLFVRIESNGCFIDTPKMGEVEKFLLKKMGDAEKKLKKWGDINWASPQQVAGLLYGKLKIRCPMKTNKGAESTSESTLKQIEHPAITDLLEFRGARQQHSFFIKGWKPYIINGRIHPSFKLHGTVTGRPSCEHPNFQQVPRDPLIRSLISAPPGRTLIEADLSQIEMRIAGELSNDPELVRCFIKGIDVHWRTMINSISDNVGGYSDDIIQTAKLYCLRSGLPPDGTSTEILLSMWRSIEGGTQPDKLIQFLCKKWEDKKSGSWEWWKSEKQLKSLLERGLPELADEEVQKKLLSGMQSYFKHLFASSQRGSHRLDQVKLSDALSLLSCIGPSIASKLLPKWSEGRKKAKAVGFGYLFGMWHKKFRIYARDNYDIHITEEEAKLNREEFFSLYKNLQPWHKKQSYRAREYGFVESLVGRKRRLPYATSNEDTYERAEAWRQAINSPVQGLASDLNLMVLLQISSEFPNTVFKPVCTVHDSILAEVRDDHIKKIVHRIEEIMRGPALLNKFNVKFKIPLMGETKLGPWGSGVPFQDFNQ